jgi:hypothetical protein
MLTGRHPIHRRKTMILVIIAMLHTQQIFYFQAAIYSSEFQRHAGGSLSHISKFFGFSSRRFPECKKAGACQFL